MTLAFAGFLRCGEFTIPRAGVAFDPSIHLTQGSVVFKPDFDHTEFLIVTLPSSKTDPFRKGVPLYISAAPGAPTCPVAALKKLYLSNPRSPDSPLFHDQDGLTPLTRTAFIACLRLALLFAGCKPELYSGRSFRRGAATAAAATGLADHKIQQLGRWRSDTYKLYIDTPKECLINLSYRLHWPPIPTPHPKPPALRSVSHLA